MDIRSPANQIKTLQFANTGAAVASKVPCVFNSVVFLPLHDADQSDLAGYAYECELGDVPKAAGAIAPGDKIYWDDTAKNFTTSSSATVLCGYALAAAGAGDATAPLIAFNSFAA